MRFLSSPPRSLLVPVVLVVGTLFLTRCDVPTSGPSFETPTQITAPVVFDKTFTFLGGPGSKHEPLVDTTTSTFDSLFTVEAENGRIFLDEEVGSFDLGSLEGAFDDAEQSLAVDTMLTASIIAHSSLSEQTVNLQSATTNPVFETAPTQPDAVPIYDATDTDNVVRRDIQADQLLGPPNSPAVGAQGATVEAVTFTEQTTHNGESVNTFTFTLTNDLESNTLTDGAGRAPVVALEAPDGSIIAEQRFPQPVSPQSSETAVLEVAGERLTRDANYRLTIDGTSPLDPDGVTLSTEVSDLRYRQATLSDVDQIDLNASTADVDARGDASTPFVGVEVQTGSPTLTIRNDQRFPLTIDRLRVTNDASVLQDLPADFPETVFTTSGQRIDAKSTMDIPLDLDGAGIASRADVTFEASVAASEHTITVAAGDELGLSAEGPLTIETLHFRPNGERVQDGGTFNVSSDKVTFQSGDFVELRDGALQITNLANELGVGFESLTMTFPGVRHAPYSPADSLVLHYEGPSTNPGNYVFRRIEANTSDRDDPEAPLANLRFMPDGNQIRYHIQGTLPTSNTVRTIDLDDKVQARISLREFDFREIAAHVQPISMNVTEDANGDGFLDVRNSAEAEQTSFDGLDGVAERIDGLTLQGSTFTVSIETNVPADTRLYAAFRGRDDQGSQTFLQGKNSRSVAPGDTIADSFASNGSKLDAHRLIQMNLEGVPFNETMTRTIVLSESNSNVDAFINHLPTSLQFVGKALLLPTNERLRVRPPLTVDAGLNVSIPLSFQGDFTLRDTVDADLSSLSDLTDPENDVNLQSATLLFDYSNQLPLGVNVQLTVVDDAGSTVITLPGENDALGIEGAMQAENGTAASPSRGTLTIDLTEEELRDLSRGDTIRIRLDVQEENEEPPARLRAFDTITFDLRTDIEGTVSVGN